MYELGGFVDEFDEFDGDYKSFNRLLAHEYVDAFLAEEFECTGVISNHFFQEILSWDDSITKEEEQLLENGQIITCKNRTLIDAVYEKRYG